MTRTLIIFTAVILRENIVLKTSCFPYLTKETIPVTLLLLEIMLV